MRTEVDEILNKDKQNNGIILLEDYMEKRDDLNSNIVDKCLSNEKSFEIEKNEYPSNEELLESGSSSS